MITYARYTMRQARCLVILDTMWGRAHGPAETWFTINPHNHSGRRLYWLTGLRLGQLWVTNACAEQTTHANAHGRPDLTWLAANLSDLSQRARHLPLLVCGRVAVETFQAVLACGWNYPGKIVQMLHPAARTWTRQELDKWQRKLHTLLAETAR